MISFLYRRQLCYDISLHSDIELTKEIFPKLKDQRVSLVAPSGDHVLSFGFPEYPIISRQGSDLVLSEMQWSVDPVYEKDPVERKKNVSGWRTCDQSAS